MQKNYQDLENFDEYLSDNFKDEYLRRQNQTANILKAEMTNNASELINLEIKSSSLSKENACPNIQPTKCFDAKLTKPRKSEPLEQSFIQLSKALQNKLTACSQPIQTASPQALQQSQQSPPVRSSTQAFVEFIGSMLQPMPVDKQERKMRQISEILFRND